MTHYFLALIAVWAGDEIMMKNCFGRSKTRLSFWTLMLIAGFGGLSLQAADDGARFYQTSFFCAVGGLLLLLAFGWNWRGRILRKHGEEIRQLKEQSAKNLQREVSEREMAQRALQESQELTLRQERLAAVGQLAAGLAHEFNNILTIIQGHASLLLDNPDMDEDSIQSITHITEGVERTAALVKQMLAFSRKQVMQQKVLHIKEAMSQITVMLGRLLGAHVVLNFDIAPQLPPIMADPEMLQQIIVNLVVNAHDAMSSGGQLTIHASEASFTAQDLAGKPDRRPGCFIQLSITDTGSGIDSATLNRLFEPFFTTKDIGKGTGLGLATVYGMVNQNSGWIEVESEIGVGTTFNIYFPVTKNAPEKNPPTPETPRVRNGKETILVVEDETVLRELVREILEVNGYHVLDAATGREALQVWNKHGKTVDLLLTDMSMPDGMSGQDLAAKLQEENPRLPVIFSSGYNQDSLERKEANGPGQTFLSKPYHPNDLAQAVRAALNHAACGQTSMASPNT
jgi:two-component system cell cycle sensor histidine kinase/response regulator CckA